ncbi:TraB/GumN family protein [Desulfococcaceae bacterium HSG8]|nr:TraB/GumN family protein [Desulfococcaceae bacterium HSG8]
MGEEEAVVTTAVKDSKCFFWTIKIGNNTAFLVGSMHLMQEDMHPLPDKFENAFSVSTVIVFEANMEEANTYELRQYVQSLGFYPPGETIWRDISQDTREKLLEKLSEMQFPVKMAEKIRPWLLSNMLEDKAEDYSEFRHTLGLDACFLKKARHEGKKFMFLESARDQVDCTAKMPASQQEFLLEDALRDELSEGEIPLNEVIELWKNGEADTLEFHYRDHHRKQMGIYQDIIINRNRRWLKKIEELFQLGENVMIIVGGGHMGGPDGLVRLLANKGYQIVQE